MHHDDVFFLLNQLMHAKYTNKTTELQFSAFLCKTFIMSLQQSKLYVESTILYVVMSAEQNDSMKTVEFSVV